MIGLDWCNIRNLALGLNFWWFKSLRAWRWNKGCLLLLFLCATWLQHSLAHWLPVLMFAAASLSGSRSKQVPNWLDLWKAPTLPPLAVPELFCLFDFPVLRAFIFHRTELGLFSQNTTELQRGLQFLTQLAPGSTSGVYLGAGWY